MNLSNPSRLMEGEREPPYRRELEHALVNTSYQPVIKDIKAWLQRLARQAREK